MTLVDSSSTADDEHFCFGVFQFLNHPPLDPETLLHGTMKPHENIVVNCAENPTGDVPPVVEAAGNARGGEA